LSAGASGRKERSRCGKCKRWKGGKRSKNGSSEKQKSCAGGGVGRPAVRVDDGAVAPLAADGTGLGAMDLYRKLEMSSEELVSVLDHACLSSALLKLLFCTDTHNRKLCRRRRSCSGASPIRAASAKRRRSGRNARWLSVSPVPERAMRRLYRQMYLKKVVTIGRIAACIEADEKMGSRSGKQPSKSGWKGARSRKPRRKVRRSAEEASKEEHPGNVGQDSAAVKRRGPGRPRKHPVKDKGAETGAGPSTRGRGGRRKDPISKHGGGDEAKRDGSLGGGGIYASVAHDVLRLKGEVLPPP